MDRHAQQFKRERQDKKRRENNIAAMSKLRSAVKNVLTSSKQDEAEKLY